MRLLEIADKRDQAGLDAFANEMKAKHGLKQLWLYDNGNGMIDLSAIHVDKASQKQGAGTGAMNDLADYADQRGLTIVLTPGVKDTGHGTTSRSRLVKFYKRFGFIENKGRNMDFAIGGGKMIRHPQSLAEAFRRSPVDHSLPFDDHESSDYIEELKKRDELWRGPHEGRYLQLFLAGKKPAILIMRDELRPFQKFVDSGQLTKHDITVFNDTPNYVLTVPGEEWRANKLRRLFSSAIADKYWAADKEALWHAKVGLLLGYTNTDVRNFMKYIAEPNQ